MRNCFSIRMVKHQIGPLLWRRGQLNLKVTKILREQTREWEKVYLDFYVSIKLVSYILQLFISPVKISAKK